MLSLLFWRLALGLLTVLILYLSLAPAPSSGGLGWDKANHTAAMAVVTLLAYCAFRPAVRAVGVSAGYALLLGVLIEILQFSLTTDRLAEWGDLMADAVGVAAAVLLLIVLKRRKVPDVSCR